VAHAATLHTTENTSLVSAPGGTHFKQQPIRIDMEQIIEQLNDYMSRTGASQTKVA
jgi:hypothetical protein